MGFFACILLSAIFLVIVFFMPLPRTWTSVLSGTADRNIVALTFDDGPHELCTPIILDALAEVEARATFFVSGWRLQDPVNIPILQRTAAEGHQLGNHRYTHAEPSPTLTDEEFEAELRLTNELIYEYTGQIVKVYRHPWGKGLRRQNQVVNELGMKVYRWDSHIGDGRDFSELCSERTHMYVERIFDAVADGRIVLMHDARGNVNSAAAVGLALPLLAEEGYEFVTLECFEELRPKHTLIFILQSRL
jgi:peptidoglycan/xylan/chitin deacetylase (PgdA/CDA1 family)